MYSHRPTIPAGLALPVVGYADFLILVLSPAAVYPLPLRCRAIGLRGVPGEAVTVSLKSGAPGVGLNPLPADYKAAALPMSYGG